MGRLTSIVLCVAYTVFLAGTVATYEVYDNVFTTFLGKREYQSNVNWWHLLYVSFFWTAVSAKYIKDEALKNAIVTYNFDIAAFSLFMFYVAKCDYHVNELYATIGFVIPVAVLAYYQHKFNFKNKRTLIKHLWKQLHSHL